MGCQAERDALTAANAAYESAIAAEVTTADAATVAKDDEDTAFAALAAAQVAVESALAVHDAAVSTADDAFVSALSAYESVMICQRAFPDDTLIQIPASFKVKRRR